MRVVYKYNLDMQIRRQVLSTPRKAKLLKVSEQNGFATMWFEVDTESQVENRIFKIFGAAQEIDEGFEFVGTVFVGNFVWHIFEQVKTDDFLLTHPVKRYSERD